MSTLLSSLSGWPLLTSSDSVSSNYSMSTALSTAATAVIASALTSSITSQSNDSSSSILMMALMSSGQQSSDDVVGGARSSPPTSSSTSSGIGDHSGQMQSYLPPSVHYGLLAQTAVAVAQQQQQQQNHHHHQHQQHHQQASPPYPQYPFAYNPNQIMWPPEDNWNSWNRVFKLILISFVSTIGSMGAIFIVSAITVIDTFQVRGNCFLVSLAFGHLLVTILVLPASAIAIMADINEDQSICHFQWLITLACFVVSVLSFLFMSIDNYFGMKSLVTYQLCCTRCRICFLVLVIWFAAFIVPFMQHSNHFGPEFCKDKRQWKIMLDYHPYALGFLILCTVITLAYFTYSLFMYKNYKIQLESTPEAANLILTDGCLLQSNVIVYVISLAMWIPLIVAMVVDSINPVPQDYLDTVWYIALSNSCSFSYMYAATNRDFREAFNKLFYYCCCKSHVTFSRKGAAIRRTVANESIGLRVHIIPGLNIYAQRKDTCATTSSYRTGGGYGSSGGMGGGHYHSSHSAGHYLGPGGLYKSHKSCEL